MHALIGPGGTKTQSKSLLNMSVYTRRDSQRTKYSRRQVCVNTCMYNTRNNARRGVFRIHIHGVFRMHIHERAEKRFARNNGAK